MLCILLYVFFSHTCCRITEDYSHRGCRGYILYDCTHLAYPPLSPIFLLLTPPWPLLFAPPHSLHLATFASLVLLYFHVKYTYIILCIYVESREKRFIWGKHTIFVWQLISIQLSQVAFVLLQITWLHSYLRMKRIPLRMYSIFPYSLVCCWGPTLVSWLSYYKEFCSRHRCSHISITGWPGVFEVNAQEPCCWVLSRSRLRILNLYADSHEGRTSLHPLSQGIRSTVVLPALVM